MKDLKFSTKFPSYHPLAGQPTFFVEKILNGLIKLDIEIPYKNKYYLAFIESLNLSEPGLKFHTIRARHDFKKGDIFQPRIWSGRPYWSKPIDICFPLKIENEWEYQTKNISHLKGEKPNWLTEIKIDGYWHAVSDMNKIAKNDGLDLDAFNAWFKYPSAFSGQIICWNPLIQY